MTYKLPEPISRDETEHNKDYYTAETTQRVADAAYAAGQRDMLERAVELIQSQPDGSYRAELITAGMIRKLKELLNEQH